MSEQLPDPSDHEPRHVFSLGEIVKPKAGTQRSTEDRYVVASLTEGSFNLVKLGVGDAVVLPGGHNQSEFEPAEEDPMTFEEALGAIAGSNEKIKRAVESTLYAQWFGGDSEDDRHQ